MRNYGRVVKELIQQKNDMMSDDEVLRVNQNASNRVSRVRGQSRQGAYSDLLHYEQTTAPSFKDRAYTNDSMTSVTLPNLPVVNKNFLQSNQEYQQAYNRIKQQFRQENRQANLPNPNSMPYLVNEFERQQNKYAYEAEF